MNILQNFNAEHFALAVLISASFFTILWLLDSRTHGRLVKIDITDKELQTHRIILLTSGLMEASLVLMYWFRLEALPLFIAAFITRTAHEFIDELHWHTDRCTFQESILHLGMWVSVLTKTFLLFIWGFFLNYQGILELPIIYKLWALLIVALMGIVGLVEWKR